MGVRDECERRARAGAGKATTPEDKTSSREDEDKPGIAPAARCESSEKDEGVCEAATGAKIARRRANVDVDVDVDVDVSSWRGRPYVCVSSWRGGWETSGLGNLRSFSPRMRQGEATEGSSFRRLDVGKRTSDVSPQHPTPPRFATNAICCEPGPLPLTPPQGRRRRPRSHTRPRRGTPRLSRARRRGA